MSEAPKSLAIETHGLSKTYKGKKVVDNVNMHVPTGSIYGFVGENGAGKTTIMRLICGLIKPSEGSYSLFGIDSKDKRIYEEKSKVSAIVEAPSLLSSLTAQGNFQYFGKLFGCEGKIDMAASLKMVGLEGVEKKKVKDYSLGMKQRLAIAISLISEPKVLMLDEPMNGLDPEGIVSLRETIINLNKKGITFLISSHILSELEKVATHYGFIGHGHLFEEICASDLSKLSKPHVLLSTNDNAKALDFIRHNGFPDSSIHEGKEIMVLGDFKLTSLIVLLEKKGFDILSITKKNQSVEEHYLAMANGGKK